MLPCGLAREGLGELVEPLRDIVERALETAFAALALAALAHPGTGGCLRPAVDHLLAAQHADGSWPGCPFIAPPTAADWS
ncbi:MAG TPA: hypothetical protein VKG45_06710 [Actinomycetes bacterium]|nr:hypothetical protein [Actinomycetes bacterium]